MVLLRRTWRQLLGASGRRRFHSGHLYVHRTVSETDKDSVAAMTVGLLGVLRGMKADVGYFRPIDATSLEGERAKLVRKILRLEDEINSMQGVNQSEAYELLVNDNMDDLLERIFVAYEAYKRRHDFVIIEGSHLDNLWKDTGLLNARIASALGATVFLATDADLIQQNMKAREDNLAWAAEVALHTRLSALAFQQLNVGVVGALVYGPPSKVPDVDVLRRLFSKWQLPFAGTIPVAGLQSDTELQDRAKAIFDDNIDHEILKRAVFEKKHVPLTPLLFQNSIMLKAKENKQVILLPEGDEPRTVQAAGYVLKHDLCSLIMLGNPEKLNDVAKQYNVDLSSAQIKDPTNSQEMEKYVDVYYQARKHKGITLEQAREVLRSDPLTLGTCMVAAGDADGMVSGAIHTTANTVRPALQIIKTEKTIPIVSSVFFICLQDRVVVYADVAINTNPSAEDLASIAIASADTASAFGIEPRVALLSYVTGDSNAGPLVQKVADAAAVATSKRPDLLIEGPFQYDAAVNPVIANIKLKGKASAVAGKANVFIFPDLNSSNIACKAVQQHTGAVAIGPVLQGLRKPVNDLSRGCTVKDIIATLITTAVQAARKNNRLIHSQMAEGA